MTRVLLAEDDPAISEPLARALRREGYDVDVRADGRAALEASAENHDLVVLDLGLPFVDGLEVCRRIRADGRTVPVLILTARADEVDTVVGLDAGADDYVTKPFGTAELVARIRALLRRTSRGTDGDDVLAFGDFVMNLGTRTLRVAGREVHLTPTEWELLRELASKAGRTLTHRHLFNAVWSPRSSGDAQQYLRVHIANVRRKIEDDPLAPRYIVTEPGVGYRFVAPA